MQRAERSVLGMGQSSEELPVSPGYQSLLNLCGQIRRIFFKNILLWEKAFMRTGITAASSFANVGAFSTPGK